MSRPGHPTDATRGRRGQARGVTKTQSVICGKADRNERNSLAAAGPGNPSWAIGGAIGGAPNWGQDVRNAMKPLADDGQSVVIPGTGHWVAEILSQSERVAGIDELGHEPARARTERVGGTGAR